MLNIKKDRRGREVLTDQMVDEILVMKYLTTNLTRRQREIADAYGVSEMTVSNICAGRARMSRPRPDPENPTEAQYWARRVLLAGIVQMGDKFGIMAPDDVQRSFFAFPGTPPEMQETINELCAFSCQVFEMRKAIREAK